MVLASRAASARPWKGSSGDTLAMATARSASAAGSDEAVAETLATRLPTKTRSETSSPSDAFGRLRPCRAAPKRWSNGRAPRPRRRRRRRPSWRLRRAPRPGRSIARCRVLHSSICPDCMSGWSAFRCTIYCPGRPSAMATACDQAAALAFTAALDVALQLVLDRTLSRPSARRSSGNRAPGTSTPADAARMSGGHCSSLCAMIDCIISWVAPNIRSIEVGLRPSTSCGAPTTSTAMTMSALPLQQVERHRIVDAAVDVGAAVADDRRETPPEWRPRRPARNAGRLAKTP